MSNSETPVAGGEGWVARHKAPLVVGLILAPGALMVGSFFSSDVIIPWIFADPDRALQWQARLLSVAGAVSAALVLLAVALGVRAIVRLQPQTGVVLKALVYGVCLVIGIWGIWLASIPPAMVYRELRHTMANGCMAKLHALAVAMRDYVEDHDGRFPPASRWCDSLNPYVESDAVFVCPAAPKLRCGYAYNAALSGLRYDVIEDADDIVAFFESDGGWNAAGGPELLVAKPRHGGVDQYAWTGGSVGPYRRGGDLELRWQPVLKGAPADAAPGP
jgi:hypothetical protein